MLGNLAGQQPECMGSKYNIGSRVQGSWLEGSGFMVHVAQAEKPPAHRVGMQTAERRVLGGAEDLTD